MFKLSSFFFVLSVFSLCAMDQAPTQRVVKRKFTDLQEAASSQARDIPEKTYHSSNPSEKRKVSFVQDLSDKRTTVEEAKPRLASVVVRVEKEQKKERKEPTIQFIYDDYTARRGEPKMLEIKCAQCDNDVIRYQKDGPGALLRCYLDRIHAPSHIKDRQYDRFDVRRSPLLSCEHCRSTIGIPMIYQLENRPAYRMLKHRFYFE